MLHLLKNLAARERFARKLNREARSGHIDIFRTATANVSTENLDKLCNIIDLMTAWRTEGIDSLVRITVSHNPELFLTIVAENYDYLQGLERKSPASAIELIQAAANIRDASRKQRRALIKFEASRHKMFRSEDITVSELLERKRGYRAVILRRPDDVDKIIEISLANPNLDRVVEIEALLDGKVVSPLSTGML